VGSPREGGLRRFAALAVATAAGAGLAPVAPGTFGSLVGVGVFALIAPFGALAVAAAALVATVRAYGRPARRSACSRAATTVAS
jgi:phosphatidylglycerophosphatase A